MRESLERLFRERLLLALALGFALGWALFELAEGIAQTVTVLLTDVGDVPTSFEALTWTVGDRVLTLGPPLRGAIEVLVVTAVAAWVVARRRRSATT